MSSLPLGYEQVKPRSLLKPELVEDRGPQHLITIAPTGSGKGVSCIIPALLSWTGPAVVIDPKGENYAVTAAYRRSLGQAVHVLDPFGVTDEVTSARLNPLDLLRLPGAVVSDDASTVVRLMMAGTMAIKQDPFWDERAETLLTGLLTHLVGIHQRSAGVDMLFSHINDCYENVAVLMRHMLVSENILVKAAGAVLDINMSGKTGASILATAQMHVSFLRNESIALSLRDSTIPLEDVVSGKPMTIYIVMPPEKLRSHAKVLRLWLGTLMTAMARRRVRPAQSTLLLLDEAAQLGELEELRTALTLMRGYAVKVWSFWQDMSQLRRLYASDWQNLLNNCGVQQYFGAVSPFAAAEIDAYLMGMVPRSVFGMKQDEMVVLKDATAPRMLTRMNYLTERYLRVRADRNPYYPSIAETAEVIPLRRAICRDVSR